MDHLCVNTGTLLRCIRCPVAYHADQCFCAGVTFLAGDHIICTGHRMKTASHINISWCLACSQGNRVAWLFLSTAVAVCFFLNWAN